jgi:hypothetical protein
MAKNVHTRYSDEGFLSAERGTISFNALDDTMDGPKVFPDKSSDARVLRNRLEGAVRTFVLRARAFNGDIIRERLGEMGDFGSEDVSDVALEYGRGVCPAHRENR